MRCDTVADSSGLMSLYAYWPDGNGLSAWEKLHSLSVWEKLYPTVKDLHVFGSYVTGHLPREHPHVIDHDDS
jgi:hypothetical protein